MPRFDAYRNPNPRATHALLLDVQSDLVRTATRWCVPLYRAVDGEAVLSRAHHKLNLASQTWVLDTPNILAVPAGLLHSPIGRLSADERLRVDSALDFMLRGY